MCQPELDKPLAKQYNVQDIPRLGPARNAPEAASERINTGDGEFIEATIGDAIIRESSVGREVRVVLEAEEHGFITWIIGEERYSYYPAEHADEDFTHDGYETAVKKNPWQLTI